MFLSLISVKWTDIWPFMCVLMSPDCGSHLEYSLKCRCTSYGYFLIFFPWDFFANATKKKKKTYMDMNKNINVP